MLNPSSTLGAFGIALLAALLATCLLAAGKWLVGMVRSLDMTSPMHVIVCVCIGCMVMTALVATILLLVAHVEHVAIVQQPYSQEGFARLLVARSL